MRFTKYIKDTQAEMKHVSWPTQKQTIVFTALVILFSIVTAAFLGVFDYFFSQILNVLISR